MRLAELRWSDRKDEGTISFYRDFKSANRVFQLDALQDWRFEIEQIYERIFWGDPNPFRPITFQDVHEREMNALREADEKRCAAHGATKTESS